MAVDLSKIANNMVRSVASGEQLCRLWAVQLSEIKPQLDENNIALIGIGLGDVSLDEFVKEEYFKGDLYVDVEKNNYKALEFKRYNVLSIIPSLATKETRNAASKANLKKITGNFKGDGLQTGGLIIVAAGGEKVLLSFKQKSPGDHVENDAILNALGITSSGAEAVGGADGATKAESKEDDATAGDEGAVGPKAEKGETTAAAEAENNEGEKKEPVEECSMEPTGEGC
ncbi:prostamide/prostaglandin F synthase-like [Dendronephthya gigantea]|uniref:prostamide/prostaglandin F synthase-like n=1 Tax=Dendronephthya gigantea TaxID=151771 RepID=UPI001069D973|nr:prostamide/prostaglandin F synthase-like [Dendronephthya gigantea]